jgi:hypothetical protein
MAAMAVAALDVDFYDSSTDGPTLRMAGTTGGMKILRDVCERLAGGEPSVRFSDLEGVSLSGNVESVEFRLGGKDGLCRHTGHPPAFVFDGDLVQWNERVLLLTHWLNPGHRERSSFWNPMSWKAPAWKRQLFGNKVPPNTGSVTRCCTRCCVEEPTRRPAGHRYPSASGEMGPWPRSDSDGLLPAGLGTLATLRSLVRRHIVQFP